MISIVSPLYNEELGAIKFIDTVAAILRGKEDFEIVLVDDGSKDNTWDIIAKEAETRSYLKCVRLSRNFGKEGALLAGLSFASGDAVITIDSDLQHPPLLIPEMLGLWRNGYDVVEAVKERRQKESFISRIFAKLFYKFFKYAANLDISGATDFRLMDKKVVESILAMPEKQVFFRGISTWVGYKRAYLPFTPEDRVAGVSKWPFTKRVNLAVRSLSSYTAKPLIAVWVMTFIFMFFSILVGGEALYSYITNTARSGFTTVILLILITGTCILLALSLLSLYIEQIFHEIKGRPTFIISETAGK